MDKYHVMELIGEGQFGKVYKGRLRYGSQIVALKFISKKGKTDKQLAELRQEIHILASMAECDYVIRMLDWFETAKEICVVTEYAQGELFEVLEDDGSLPEAAVRLIAIQLVSALQYLHAHRIIHRDLKPQNILIGASGILKVADFGFARSMSANTSLLTSIKGTPLYLAPELVRDMPYDHRADLWSLGCILYELFVGQPPFFTNSFYTLVHLIVHNEVEYPSTMSDHCKDFLQGLLQKTPSKRLSWPQLADHPFIRETPEEQATRAEAVRRVHAQQVWHRHLLQANQTPRGDQPEIKGFGGVKKPATAGSLHQQQQLLQQQQAKSTSQTARPVPSSTASTVTSSNSSSSSNGTFSSASSGTSTPSGSGARSRSSSLEFDVAQLGNLLAPRMATPATLRHALDDLATTLQSAASSTAVPSPLLTLMPQLVADHAPAHLCALLLAVQTGAYPSVTLNDVLAPTLRCLRLMAHPTGGRLALAPLAFEEQASGAGRSLPSFEVQLRRYIGERLVHAPVGGAGGAAGGNQTVLDILARTFCAKLGEQDLSAPNAQPSPALASTVVLLFQLARSSSASPPTSATAGGTASASFLDHLSRNSELLSGVLSLLATLSSNLTAGDVSERACTAGRVLLLLATLIGKSPPVVKSLMKLQPQPFEPALAAKLLEHPNQLVSLGASFLLAQLLTNQHAHTEAHVASPLRLLQVVHAKLEMHGTTVVPTAIVTTEVTSQSSKASSSPVLTPIALLEGTGLTYSLLGSLDGYLQVLQAVLYFLTLQANNPAAQIVAPAAVQPCVSFLLTRVWDVLLARLERLRLAKAIASGSEPSPEHRLVAGELSVQGWMAFLAIVLDLLKYAIKAQASGGGPASAAAGFDPLFRGMCDLLSPMRVANLYAWPDGCGGGASGVGLLLKRVLNVLYMPFTANGSGGGDGAMLARVQKLLFNESLVRRLLVGLKYTSAPSELELPVGFLAQLCMRSPYFERQLLEFNGLQLFSAKGLLNPEPRVVPAPPGHPSLSGTITVTPSPALLTDAMHVVTQLARSSAEHYPAIHAANFFPALSRLLHHADSGVRAKTCNVLGNLCRHSSYFYPALLSAPAPGLLGPLVSACCDSSPAVRKWAAFALGNAVFHDASLAGPVALAIPPLVAMLSGKEEEKAAANAAGVLANLLRHGQAADVMLQAGAVPTLATLVQTVLRPKVPAPEGPTSVQLQCARSALFSLCHLAASEAGRSALQAPNVRAGLQATMAAAGAAQDAKVQAYFQRLQARMQ